MGHVVGITFEHVQVIFIYRNREMSVVFKTAGANCIHS